MTWPKVEGIATRIWVTSHYLRTVVYCTERWATITVRRQAITALNAGFRVGDPLTAGALRLVPHGPNSQYGTAPDTSNPRMTLPRIEWIRLNRLHTDVGRFRSCLYDWGNGVCPPLRPMSVAQKNKPSTMLSSKVQPIDLVMYCNAWRFWTMRQSNGCSTSAPGSGAAKQCL